MISRVWEVVPPVLKVHPSALQQLGLLQETQSQPQSQTQTHTQSQSDVKEHEDTQFVSSFSSSRAIPASYMPQMKLVVSKTKDRTNSADRMVCSLITKL